jgi:hypothetical protein
MVTIRNVVIDGSSFRHHPTAATIAATAAPDIPNSRVDQKRRRIRSRGDFHT